MHQQMMEAQMDCVISVEDVRLKQRVFRMVMDGLQILFVREEPRSRPQLLPRQLSLQLRRLRIGKLVVGNLLKIDLLPSINIY
jgi:hypothetical protein